MIHNINNKISKLKESSMTRNHNNWFELKDITNQNELSKQYATICHQHNQQKKWVLFINPVETSLERLSSIHGVDISKVLCVTVKGKQVNYENRDDGVTLNIEQIKSVLCRGNCSAVILSNANLAQQELNELNSCAQLGQTQCVLLSTAQGINIH
jgi:cell division inhibitor SulA